MLILFFFAVCDDDTDIYVLVMHPDHSWKNEILCCEKGTQDRSFACKKVPIHKDSTYDEVLAKCITQVNIGNRNEVLCNLLHE